jgi:hypothetical protein
MKLIKILSLVIVMAVLFSLQSCRNPQESSEKKVRIDTLYCDSIVTDTLWLTQLQEDSYYWLICDGINGLDTLGHLWLKRIEPSDTNTSGWEMLIFSADPESSVYNAMDFFITHAPEYGSE